MQDRKDAYIENLRIFLISLVVLHHLACTYGGLGMWYYEEQPSSHAFGMLLTTFAAVNQSFFMGLFFLISAYFAPKSVNEKGLLKYVADRLIRLGIPLLVFFFILSPISRYLVIKYKHQTPISLWPYLLSMEGVSFGPLWFVEALLYFTLIYALMCSIFKIKRIEPTQATGALNNGSTILLFIFLTGLLTAIVRLWAPVDVMYRPLGFRFSHFIQYVFMFGLGILAYRNQWFTTMSYKKALSWFFSAQAVIFLITPILLFFGGALSGKLNTFYGGLHWQAFSYAFWEQLVGIGLILGLIGVFYYKINRQPKWAKHLSNSAYAVFIIHTPILVGLGIAFQNIQINTIYKFIILAPVSLIICFSAAVLIRKIPFVKRVV